MYDPLTSRYAFACPVRGETHVLLSAFRSIEQLPGAAHPAVFRVRFDCGCGEEHDGLADARGARLGAARAARGRVPQPHDRASRPRGRGARRARSRAHQAWGVAVELLLLSRGAGRVRCSRPRSRCSRRRTGPVGLAVRCPSCRRLSLNLVSHSHVDVPFHNDREIGVVEHVFAEDALSDARRVPRRSSGRRRSTCAGSRSSSGFSSRRIPRRGSTVALVSGNGTR